MAVLGKSFCFLFSLGVVFVVVLLFVFVVVIVAVEHGRHTNLLFFLCLLYPVLSYGKVTVALLPSS